MLWLFVALSSVAAISTKFRLFFLAHPSCLFSGVASPMVGHLDGHDPKTNDAAFKKYQWSKNHFGDDRWNNAEIDQFSSEDVVKEPLYEFLEGFGDNFQMIRCNT